MKGIKKIFMLLTFVWVLTMCVGCVSPSKAEHNIAMKDSKKGTYSVKYTFNKQSFSNLKYAKATDYDSYVKELESKISKDVGMELNVDSTSSSTNVYLTVSIEFSSVTELNTKLNKINAESNKLYNANLDSGKCVDEYALINNACSNENLDTALQDTLKSSNIEFDVNSEQYKVLNYAVTTGEEVYSLADIQASQQNALKYQKQTVSSENSNEKMVYLEKDKQGKQRIAVTGVACNQVYSYLYNMAISNSEQFCQTETLKNDSQTYINQLITRYRKAVCEKFVSSIGTGIFGQTTATVYSLSNITTKELMTKFYANNTTLKSIYSSGTLGVNIGILSNKFQAKFKCSYTIETTTITATYEDVTTEEIVVEDNSQEVVYVEPEEVDNSPKTGDALPTELMLSLCIFSLITAGFAAVSLKRHKI